MAMNAEESGTRLKQALVAAHAAGLACYVLVDAALIHGFDSRRYVGCRPLEPFGTSGDAGHALPHLIRLDPHASTFAMRLQHSCEWAVGCDAATWVATPLSEEQLISALSSRCIADLPGNLRVFLRFADARVLPKLLQTLTSVQREDFLSVVRSWWYFDRQNVLGAFEGQRGNPPVPTMRIELDEQQECTLLESAEADAVIRILKEHATVDEIFRMDKAHLHALVDQQIDRARRIGITSTADFALFAFKAIQEGKDFSMTDPWPERLRRVSEGKLALVDCLTTSDVPIATLGSSCT